MAYPNSYQNPYTGQYPNSYQLLNLPQARQIWNEYGQPAVDYAVNQIAPKVGMVAGVGIPAGAIPYFLNNPQGRLAALAATHYGAPIVNGLRNVANNTTVQKVGNQISKFADWIF